MNIHYRVSLTDEERKEIQELVSSGRRRVRDTKRAQVLLGADAGATDVEIARLVGVGTATVFRVKRRFVEEGLQAALHDRPRPGAGRKLTGHEEALLVATACTTPPAGRSRWTIELLAGQMVRLTEHPSISRETVRRRLAENELKPWQQKMWCIPKVDAEFVARMEDVLELYAEEPDPEYPVVCVDESPVQLLGEVRVPTAAKPAKPESVDPPRAPRAGTPAHVDYEYQRKGTANLFVMLDAHRPWRHVEVTDHRAAPDFASRMRELVDVHYPHAQRIRVVVDNLSTHTPAALYQSLPPPEARRILRRLEFHYTPKHASWLNMVEIEIGVLKSQCLDRRIGEKSRLIAEIASWEKARNAARARIRWMFTIERAREKMGRTYPAPFASPVAAAA